MTVPATDRDVWHTLHRLTNYPVPAALARKVTELVKLDGRARPYIYEAALPRIDWQAVPVGEWAFMRSLGIELSRGQG